MTRIVIEICKSAREQLDYFRAIERKRWPQYNHNNPKDRRLIDSMIFDNMIDFYSIYHGGPAVDVSPSVSPSPEEDDDYPEEDDEPYSDSLSLSPSPSPKPETLREWLEKIKYDILEWWESFLYD